MFEADLATTERTAYIDGSADAALRFVAASIDQARAGGHEDLVWHFYSRDVVSRIPARLESVAKALLGSGEYRSGPLTIHLATKRAPAAGSWNAPVAAWWPDDTQLLNLDTTQRPFVCALVSSVDRAPIWVAELARVVNDSDIANASIDVPEALQEVVAAHSRSITLSTNGIHDSLGPALIRDVRAFLKRGDATPQAVALAALRAGWWPEKIPDLLSKL